MATEVTLPEFGAEIEDVTISRWLVSEGQEVDAGDPLLEIATAKVDTVIPAPVGGIVLSIRFSVGEIVELNSILAFIGEPGEATPDSPERFQGSDRLEGDAAEGGTDEPGHGKEGELSPAQEDPIKATPVARRIAEAAGVSLTALGELGESQITKSDVESYLQGRQAQSAETDKGPQRAPAEESVGAEERARTGPVTPYDDVAPLEVRRLAASYDLDLNEVAADRPLSTLRRHDLLRYAEEQGGIPGLSTGADYPRRGRLTVSRARERKREESVAGSLLDTVPERVGEQLVPHSRMRLAIARNTVASAFTAPHVTTVHCVNMSAVTGHYQAHRGRVCTRRCTVDADRLLRQGVGRGAESSAGGKRRVDGRRATYQVHLQYRHGRGPSRRRHGDGRARCTRHPRCRRDESAGNRQTGSRLIGARPGG